VCGGKGQVGVRRTITQQVVRADRFDFKVGEGDSKIDPTGLSEDMKTALTSGTAFTLAETDSGGNSFIMDFRGYNSCHEIVVHLRGVDNAFLYTTCGDRCDPVSKPQLFDYVSEGTMRELGEIASDTDRDFNERRLSAVSVLKNNEVLTRTVKGMDTVLASVLGSRCKKAGINYQSIRNPEDWHRDPQLRSIVSKARPEYLARVSGLLRTNAGYFISKEFANEMAVSLVNLMPLMAREKRGGAVWNATSILTWMVTGLIMFLSPNYVTAAVMLLISMLLAVGVSLVGTRNLFVYMLTSNPGITHFGRRIPNMRPDLMAGVKFLAVNLCVIMFVIVLCG
jgi:hypothetical protein